MEKLTLSENVVDAVLEAGPLISRERYRSIKGFNRTQMERYIAEIYKCGFIDGLDAVQKAVEEKASVAPLHDEAAADEEVSVDWEDVLKVIGEVHGVGPKLLGDIDKKLREAF